MTKNRNPTSCFNTLTRSNQNTTPSTHHLHGALELTTLLHHESLRRDQTILTPKNLIIIHFEPIFILLTYF